LKTNGYASYEIVAVEKSQEAGWQVAKIRVRRAGTIPLPVPVAARFVDGSRTRLWTDLLIAEQTMEFRSRTPIREAILDPARELPLVNPPPIPEYQELVSKVLEMPWTGAGDQAAAFYKQARKLKVKDGDVLLKLWMSLYDGRHYEEALDACRDAAELYKGSDNVRFFIAMYWQGIVLDVLGRREEALERYREALPLAGDLKIQHSQYDLLIDRAWVEQRLKEPFMQK
jgi:tetratricopeptide (TPR) repeat protein